MVSLVNILNISGLELDSKINETVFVSNMFIPSKYGFFMLLEVNLYG